MKTIKVLSIVVGGAFIVLTLSLIPAEGQNLRAKVLQHAGKTFTASQDPDFLAYDQALRDYVSKRIERKYKVTVDPKKYSGFELLEIEAFLKCKKSTEKLDPFLAKFRTQ
jgi:hypothetical protein